MSAAGHATEALDNLFAEAADGLKRARPADRRRPSPFPGSGVGWLETRPAVCCPRPRDWP